MAWWQTLGSKVGKGLDAAVELNEAYDAILVAEAAMRDAVAKMAEAKVQITEAVAAIKALKQPN
jgi:hypothetical protein